MAAVAAMVPGKWDSRWGNASNFAPTALRRSCTGWMGNTCSGSSSSSQRKASGRSSQGNHDGSNLPGGYCGDRSSQLSSGSVAAGRASGAATTASSNTDSNDAAHLGRAAGCQTGEACCYRSHCIPRGCSSVTMGSHGGPSGQVAHVVRSASSAHAGAIGCRTSSSCCTSVVVDCLGARSGANPIVSANNYCSTCCGFASIIGSSSCCCGHVGIECHWRKSFSNLHSCCGIHSVKENGRGPSCAWSTRACGAYFCRCCSWPRCIGVHSDQARTAP